MKQDERSPFVQALQRARRSAFAPGEFVEQELMRAGKTTRRRCFRRSPGRSRPAGCSRAHRAVADSLINAFAADATEIAPRSFGRSY
jgi:hypothetical protein